MIGQKYVLVKMFKLIFVFCLSVCAVLAKNEVYDGASLYEVIVNDLDQAKMVHQIETDLDIEMWSHAIPGTAGQVLLAQEQKEIFLNALSSQGIEYKLLTDNVREQIEMEEAELAASAARSNFTGRGLSFDTIHRWGVVDNYLVELARDYPDTVTVQSAGTSFEGRDIKYIKISTTNFEDRTKPIVMLQSLIHAREWVTLPASLYAIRKLVIDVTERDLLEDIDWIIMPVVNPDGYEFTHTTNRYWRKNRATGYAAGNMCMGVDLNRNFDIFWGSASSTNVCSETFHGRGAFSEPEAAATRDIVVEYGSRMELFFDIHSFGSMMLYGYGNGQLPPHVLTLNLVAVNIAQEIDRVKRPYNPNYIVGNTFHVLYAVSGGCSDWVMGVGVPYSYTPELPAARGNSGLAGFLVNADFIEQAGYETWRGITNAARFARDNFRRRNGY